MNVLETEWWTLALPPEWWAESEEEAILIGDRDGVGCIEISTLCKEEGEFDQQSVREMAVAQATQALDWAAVSLGDFRGLAAQYVEQEAAIREWLVASGPHLLFITYSCDQENSGLDAGAVDEILDTLLAVS